MGWLSMYRPLFTCYTPYNLVISSRRRVDIIIQCKRPSEERFNISNQQPPGHLEEGLVHEFNSVYTPLKGIVTIENSEFYLYISSSVHDTELY